MKHLNLFMELIRIKKPIGFMLLFWPCAWGITIAYDFNKNLKLYFFYLILFFLGSVLMRSAGCIVNDIFDKEFDKRVARTKNRPIASEKISITQGILYSVLLCFLALMVLINFNNLTIALAIGSMPLAFTYPLMKRFTYWPQLFLGITFNYGIILGWTSTFNEINIIPIILYIGAIFWTLGYDTIYGYQDIKDDEIIGIKSTSIRFKSNPKKIIFLFYLFFILSILIVGKIMEFKIFFYLFIIFTIYHLLYYQIKNLDITKPPLCLKIFKSNNILGLIVLLNIVIGKLNI